MPYWSQRVLNRFIECGSSPPHSADDVSLLPPSTNTPQRFAPSPKRASAARAGPPSFPRPILARLHARDRKLRAEPIDLNTGVSPPAFEANIFAKDRGVKNIFAEEGRPGEERVVRSAMAGLRNDYERYDPLMST